MDFEKSFAQKLFRSDDSDFEKYALELFQCQVIQNPVYHEYIQNLGIHVQDVTSIYQIPYLPISFFKQKEVITGKWQPQQVFESSGTTSSVNSKHFVRDSSFYVSHTLEVFKTFYEDPSNFHIMALLPSYLERGNSSLVDMVQNLINRSESKFSGFYLDDLQNLNDQLLNAKATGRQIILIGVSFALLDFVERFQIDLSGNIIMETGGMKGRRKEVIREELHKKLKLGFNVENIHSEYGMTELFSQAYSTNNGIFELPKSMKFVLRDMTDPFHISSKINYGGINVIDLANFDTCAFIETQDIGRKKGYGIEILGRIDNSDVRGCNLMV